MLERKRNECLGLMLSISRKCKRTIRNKAKNEQCTTEDDCQDLYSKCHDRLRRRHFIREMSCQKVTRGRVPLCEAETRFIAAETTPQEPKFDDERLLRIFERLSNITDPDLLSDPETPQGQAFQWIAQEDTLGLDANNVTLGQRYILANLYFATNGDGWDRCYRGAPESDCRPIRQDWGIPQAPNETSLIRFRGNGETDLCIAVNNAVNGANLILKVCDMEDSRMLWALHDDRQLRLRADYSLCAGVSNRNNNQVVELFGCNRGTENQRWHYNLRGDSEFSLSGSICMTTEDGSSPRQGDAITISSCDGNLDQAWGHPSMTSTSLRIPSFLSPLHECYWYGVDCSNGTHVVGISLDRNNLIGKVPEEFGQLPHLRRLHLSSIISLDTL